MVCRRNSADHFLCGQIVIPGHCSCHQIIHEFRISAKKEGSSAVPVADLDEKDTGDGIHKNMLPDGKGHIAGAES